MVGEVSVAGFRPYLPVQSYFLLFRRVWVC